MKLKRYDVLSYITLITVIFSFLCTFTNCLASNGCYWDGMNKTEFTSSNMKTYIRGYADKNRVLLTKPPSKLDDQVGALEFTEQVDFRADFHLRLHCYITKDSHDNSWAFDGIAINFGKNQVYTSGIGELIGYGGITNAFVIELDYHQNDNRNDPNDHHMSIHECLGSKTECTPDESEPKTLPNHYKYSQFEDKELIIDVLHKYEQQEILVYINNFEQSIIQYKKKDLPLSFKGEAKLGFSTFIRGTKREVTIHGPISNTSKKTVSSYICQQGSTTVRPQVFIRHNGKDYPSTSSSSAIPEFKAGSELFIHLVFNSKRSQEIHTEYKITFSDNMSSLGTKTVSSPTVTHAFYPPTSVGEYIITFSDKYGDDIVLKYKIIPSDFDKLYYYGFEPGVKDTTSKGLIKIDNAYHFRWGSLQDKRFLISDFAKDKGYFLAYFQPQDKFKNIIPTVSLDNDKTTLMDVFNLDVQGPGIIQEAFVDKYSDGVYALKILIETSGNFTVSSQSLDTTTTINFEVLSGTPSAMSKCKTGYQSTPTLRDGVTVTYECSLVDNWNVPIKPTQGRDEFGLSYKCVILRNDNVIKELETVINDNTFSCAYTTSINGNFKFEASWIADSIETTLNSVIPSFKVVPEPKSLLNAKIYDFSSQQWYSMNDAINADVYFNIIKTTEDGAIIAIDFLDDDNTSFSDIGYDHYDSTKLTGSVSSVHLPLHNKANTIHNLVEFNGMKVIKVTVNDFDVVFTLNSFHYEITLTYRDDTVILKYKTPLDKVGAYTACHHPLSHSHTQLLLHSDELLSTKVDTLISIGSIILKTECDLLHNYFLTDDVYDKFNFDITPLNTDTEIYIEKNTSITGVYDITMKSTNASAYNVYITFNNVAITNNHFACVVHPLEIAAIIEADDTNEYSAIDTVNNVYELAQVFTADETPRIYFIAKDKFKNQLSYEPTTSNQYLHLAVTFTVDNVIDTSSSSLNFIKYDNTRSLYYIEDNSKKAGEYVITLTATTTNNELRFKYTKHPGKVSLTHSVVTVTNTKQMKSNSKSKVTVDLLDAYDNNIGVVDELFTQALAQLTVNAYSNTNNTLVIDYSCDKHAQLASVECVSGEIKDVNTYIVKAKHNEEEILICNSCMFDVVYSLFDTENSVVKAIVKSSVITMSTGSALRVVVDDFIKQTPPMFQLELRTTSGELVENVEKFINIQFALENDDGERITLQTEWVTNNIKLYSFNAQDEQQLTLLNGVYDLNVYYNEGIEKSFKVIFIPKAETDYDDVNALNETTLFISNEEIYVTAGVAYQFVIEFRTEEDYRYTTTDIAIEDIHVEPSIEDEGFGVTLSHGALKGQIIVDVILTRSTTFEAPNVLVIKYGEMRFTNTVKAIVTNGELYSLRLTSEDVVVDTSSLTSQLTAITTEDVKKVVFVPYDKYNNIKRDLFNDVELIQTHIQQVISLTHTDTNSPLSYNVTYNITAYEIVLHIQSLHIGKVYLYSQYFNDVKAYTYVIPIQPGKLSLKSVAFISKANTHINAGNAIELHLHTKDVHGNSISDITVDDVKQAFTIGVTLLNDVNADVKYDISVPVFDVDHFVYSVTLFTKGKNVVSVLLHNEALIDVTYNIVNVNCNVQNGINNSVIVYDGVVYDNTQTLLLSKATLPLMYMQFYDMYGNEYEIETMFETVNVVFNNDMHNMFCAVKYNNQIMFSVCDATSWKDIAATLIDSAVTLSFTFYAHSTDELPQHSITYNVSVDNKEDTTISNDNVIDISKTIIKESTITLTAGVYYQLPFETRTADNKRPNTFMTVNDINERISVSFTSNNEAFTTTITPAMHYGEYIITIYTEKSCASEDEVYLTLSIDDTPLDKYKVHVIVKPNTAVRGYFVNALNEQLTSLDDATCDDVYALRAILLDKYNNKARGITSNDFNYRVTHHKLPYTIESNVKLNDDASFTFELRPIYAGNYEINSPYWNDGEYTFTAVAGEIDASNSYIGSDSTTAIAGETKKVYIVPYDKHGNYISPTNVDEFIMYRHVFINGEYNVINGGVIDVVNIINSENVTESINAIVYDVTFKKSGDNIMSGVYQDKNLKCVQCVVNVSAGNVKLSASTLVKYSVDANAFVEVNGVVKEIEYNDKTLPLFRLYPKDEYGNTINYVEGSEINVSFSNKQGELLFMFDVSVNENNTYYDITLNNNDIDTYQSLEYGVYTVTLSDNLSNEISFDIILTGGDDSKETTASLDVDSTYVLYQDLTFIAGDGGYLILQLRNSNGLPYVNPDSPVETPSISITTCNSASSFLFNYTTLSPATSSIVYISVNSTYANTYPIYTACPLTLTINGDVPPSSKETLLMKVSPSILNRAYVLSEYLQDTTTLHATNADVDLQFKLNVVDKFNNIAKATPSDVKLTVRSSSTSQVISSSLITSSTEITTGYIKYSVSLYKVDKYELTAGSNAYDEDLFINKYTVYNSYGAVDMSKSSIVIKNKVLEAGQRALMVITPYDKHSNAIPPLEIADSITVNVIASINNEVVDATYQISSDAKAIEYVGALKYKGDNVWHVYLHNNEVDCYSCVTDVYPTKCDPAQTLVYFVNENRNNEQAGNATSTLYSHVDNPLSLSLSFRDVYGNDIDSVDSTISVVNAVMSGNHMDEIVFETKRSTDMTKYRVELPSDDVTVYKFTHLVQREMYRFVFNVNVDDEDEAMFMFNVSHYTNKNDTLYGNGVYKCDKTYISSDDIIIRAGETASVNVKLYTEHDEMYNDDIDLNKDIEITSPQGDETFKAVLSKQSQAYANYTLQITSTKATEVATAFTIRIKEYNTNNYITVKTIALTVNIGDPYPAYTTVKINDKNVGEFTEIDENTMIKLEFALYDKYNNKFNNEDILDYIYIRNHGSVLSSELIYTEKNDLNYQALFPPKYPPVEMSINIYYNDGTFETNLLEDPIALTIKTKVNWQSTQIISDRAYSLTAGDVLDMKLKLFDKSGICVDKVDDGVIIKIAMKGPLENAPQDYEYTFIQHAALPNQVCSMYYELVINEYDKPFYTTAGTYTLTLTAYYPSGETHSIRKISQRVTPGAIDINNFILNYNYDGTQGYDIPTNVKAGECIQFTINARDKYANAIQTSFMNEFAVEFRDGDGNVLDTTNYTISDAERTPGDIEYMLNIYKKGKYDIYAQYNGNTAKINIVKGPTSFFIIAGSCSSRNPKVNEQGFESIMTSIEASFDLICLDDYMNELSKGGEVDAFDVKINLNVSNSFTVIKNQLIDNEDGTYMCKFTPPLEGIYNIKVLLHNNEYFTKSIEVSSTNCKGDTPILCQNTLKCVSDILDCISDRGECADDDDHPFRCNVNGKPTCVSSQTECDCPSGYEKCGYMNVCVPKFDMCQFSLPVNCNKYGSGLQLCGDGICRKNTDLSPNQVVCPIGFVLCGDLTCRTTYDQCHVYEDCDVTEIRCNDMSCVSDQKLCPSTVSCNDPSKKVCPDGSCVDNEWNCTISSCPDENPIRCSDNSCVKSIEDCPKNVACGHGLTLCSDFICREEC